MPPKNRTQPSQSEADERLYASPIDGSPGKTLEELYEELEARDAHLSNSELLQVLRENVIDLDDDEDDLA